MPKMKNAAPDGHREGGAKSYTSREQFTALVRERATGKWHGILRSLGVPDEALRNRHGPCPGCGGVDRFRFDDIGGRGSFVCGGGGDRLTGDGFTLLQHVFGLRFPDAVDAVARDLGLTKGEAVSDDQRRQWQAEARQRRAHADAERERKHRTCADDASRLWLGAQPAGTHAYLQSKNVHAHGIRQRGGLLLVPMLDAEGALWNVQKIDGGGQKRFLPGRKRGLFHLIGEPGSIIAVAEGYATAATVHEVTGWQVACAFDAGNLRPVAAALSGSFPKARIVIAGDHDQAGLNDGRAAAHAVGGSLIVPGTPGQDWNDAPADELRAAVELLHRKVAA